MSGKRITGHGISTHPRRHLGEIVARWHRVPVPRGNTMDEVKTWLDANLRHAYWWDTTNATGTINCIWLEDHEDLVLYRLVWEEHA